MAESQRALAKLGLVGLVTVLLLPEAAILVVIGIAASWWLAGLLAVSYVALLIVLHVASRSPQGFLGRRLGIADDDALDFSWYTPRNLFLRPFIQGMPAAIALIIVVFVTADDSLLVTVAAAVPSAIVGYGAGGLLWSWMEKRRRRDEAVTEGKSFR